MGLLFLYFMGFGVESWSLWIQVTSVLEHFSTENIQFFPGKKF